MLNINNLRQEYNLKSLDIKDLQQDPFLQFYQWFEEAQSYRLLEPNAMVLATASKEAKPSSRTVLLKSFDSKGFIFFTHYNSRKGQELAENPFASATFLWKELQRQTTIEGSVEKISKEMSDIYFKSRPRGSQLGTHASRQGQVISSRQILEEAYYQLEKQYEGQEIPIPANWGGYCLIPQRFEFWQGRPNRLHDRFEYVFTEGTWMIQRLSP